MLASGFRKYDLNFFSIHMHIALKSVWKKILAEKKIFLCSLDQYALFHMKKKKIVLKKVEKDFDFGAKIYIKLKKKVA